MHFYPHTIPLSLICLLMIFHSVRATNVTVCDLPIGPLYNPKYDNSTNLRVTYYSGVGEVSYMEGTRYEIYLQMLTSLNRSFKLEKMWLVLLSETFPSIPLQSILISFYTAAILLLIHSLQVELFIQQFKYCGCLPTLHQLTMLRSTIQ